MMDDYVFLEDMSRKVGEWGQNIVRGGYGYGYSHGTLQGEGGRRGRARMGPGPPGKGKKTWSGGISMKKRDILKSQLELRDIEMDLFPSGMERRTLNQSTWDTKYVWISNSPLSSTELGSQSKQPVLFLSLPQEEDSFSDC
jgi:hypothetical protein